MIIINLKKIKLIFIVAILTWLSLAAWALSSPIGASPDEDFHQTILYCTGAKTEQCFPHGARYGHCFSMRPSISANCANYANLTEPKASQILLGQYPPLYYNFMALFIGDNLSITTILIRLVNVTFAVFFALCSIGLTQKNYKPAVVISWIVASMPTGMYFISSLNPTAWIIISVASIWGPLLSLFYPNENSTNQNKANTIYNKINKSINLYRIIFIIAATSLGLGSRVESLIWLPLTFLIFLFLFLPTRIVFNKRKILKILFFITLLFLMIYFILGQYIFEKFSGIFISANSISSSLGKYYQLFNWSLIQNTFNILIGVTGIPGVPGSGLGTHDIPIPAIAFIFIAYALFGCIFLGLSKLYLRKVIALGFLMFFILFITSFLLTLKDWEYLQGRYFLPMLFPFIGIFLFSNEKNFLGSKLQWLIILFSLAIANSLVLLSISLRFMYGVVYQKTRYPLTPNAPDINPNRLFIENITSWWGPNFPLSPSDLWIIGSVCFACLMLITWRWLCCEYFAKL